jgi:hypothetical protein
MSTLATLRQKISVMDCEGLIEVMNERRNIILDLANYKPGKCKLDRKPARLEAPSPNAGLAFWRVRTLDGSRSAIFTEAVVRSVVREGGLFRTKAVRQYACC